MNRTGPDLQERILGFEAVDGVEPIGERALRPVARASCWDEQRALFDALLAPKSRRFSNG
jgi:hypothetical protein